MCDVFFRIRCSSEYESLHFQKCGNIYIYIIYYWRFLISNNIAKIGYIDFFSLKYYRYSRF